MLPIGAIILWSGQLTDIPDHWQLCDGTNGTPDIRDKFVCGAGPAYPQGTSGGKAEHHHTYGSNPHAHTILPGNSLDAGTDFDKETQPSQAYHETRDGSSMPPYYCLAFIMKVV